jgi:hypothetical protein
LAKRGGSTLLPFGDTLNPKKPQNWCVNDCQTHFDALAKRGGSTLFPFGDTLNPKKPQNWCVNDCQTHFIRGLGNISPPQRKKEKNPSSIIKP